MDVQMMMGFSSNPRHRRQWSELPVELLELVFSCRTLDSLDLLRCRNVCLSWRDVILNFSTKHDRRVVFPGLLLPCVLFLPGRHLRTNSAEVYRLNLPVGDFRCQSHGQPWHCSYSHNGWLLLASGPASASTPRDNLYKETLLYNPLSGVRIRLPRCTDSFRYPFRPALSSSLCGPGTIVLCYSIPVYRFAFYILGDGGGSEELEKWTFVDPCYTEDAHNAADMVYHKGRFWAISNGGTCLLVFELDRRDCPPKVRTITLKQPPFYKYNVPGPSTLALASMYLVVLPAQANNYDDGLLLIARYRQRSKNTIWFRVFMLVKRTWDPVQGHSRATWKEIHNFGGSLALFLNRYDSFFVNATSDDTLCRRNSVYFVDEVTKMDEEGRPEEIPLTKRGDDMGLFDLETKRFESFYNAPFNRWFVPEYS